MASPRRAEPHEVDPLLTLDPLLRWAGGKRWLAPILGPRICAHLEDTGGRYIEPFAGAAAVAFWMGLPRTLLADSCQAVIDCYWGVSRRPRATREALRELVSWGIDENAYYTVRGLSFTKLEQKAARVLYLNKLCYNGLWRENKKGWMNVPLDGSKEGVTVPTKQAMEDYAEFLRLCELRCCDFEGAIEAAEPGDLVYADPPYIEGFAGYTADGFDIEDQEDLAAILMEAADRGVTVVTTNADHPKIRRFYRWAHVAATRELRAISCEGAGRVPADCLLISNEPEMLP